MCVRCLFCFVWHHFGAHFIEGYLMKSISINVTPTWGMVGCALGCVLYFGVDHLLSLPFLIIGVWGMTPARRLPRVVAENAFPLYLMHMFVLLLFGTHKWNSPALAILIGCAGIAATMGLVVGVRKFAPGFARIAFGGR